MARGRCGNDAYLGGTSSWTLARCQLLVISETGRAAFTSYPDMGLVLLCCVVVIPTAGVVSATGTQMARCVHVRMLESVCP